MPSNVRDPNVELLEAAGWKFKERDERQWWIDAGWYDPNAEFSKPLYEEEAVRIQLGRDAGYTSIEWEVTGHREKCGRCAKEILPGSRAAHVGIGERVLFYETWCKSCGEKFKKA